MPERIRRKRTAGWRMPEGAVYVGRPSRWKNPYKITTSKSGQLIVVTVDRYGTERGERWAGFTEPRDAAEFAVDLYRRMLLAAFDRDPEARIDYLHGLADRNLACWCPLSAPCHADVLLEMANSQGGQL